MIKFLYRISHETQPITAGKKYSVYTMRYTFEVNDQGKVLRASFKSLSKLEEYDAKFDLCLSDSDEAAYKFVSKFVWRG